MLVYQKVNIGCIQSVIVQPAETGLVQLAESDQNQRAPNQPRYADDWDVQQALAEEIKGENNSKYMGDSRWTLWGIVGLVVFNGNLTLYVTVIMYGFILDSHTICL